MDWISVNDRLPENGQRVFCGFRFHVKGQNIKADICLALEYWDGFNCSEYSKKNEIKEIEYWMPIPALPKEIDEE